MPYYLHKRYDLAAGAEVSYGAFPAEAADCTLLRADADGFAQECERTRLENDSLRADLAANASLVGNAQSTVKFTVPIRGGGEATGLNENAEAQPDLDLLLGSCLQYAAADHGAKPEAGATRTLRMQNDSATAFTVGGLQLIDPDGSGTLYPRWIGPADDDGSLPFTCWRGQDAWALPRATTENARTYAAVNFLPGFETRHSLALEVSGAPYQGLRPIWRHTGLVGNAKITDAAAGKRLGLSVDLKGDLCLRTEGATALSGHASLRKPHGRAAELRALGATLWFNGRPLRYRQFALDLGNEFAELADASCANGRAGYKLIKRAPNGQMLTYYDAGLLEAYESGALFDCAYFAGDAKSGFGFHAVCCQIKTLKESEINGLLAFEIAFAVLASDVKGVPDYGLSLVGRLPS